MNNVISLKGLTIALIVGLVYEIVFKLSVLAAPGLPASPQLFFITAVISAMIALIIVLFMLSFYREEGSHRGIALTLKILIASIVLHFVFRQPVMRGIADFRAVRMVGEILGCVAAVSLFALLVFYIKAIPAEKSSIRAASLLAAIMFALGIVKSLLSLSSYVYYVVSGVMIEPHPVFLGGLYILFLVTHVSVIWFLYRYYQLKFPRVQAGMSAAHK